MTVLKITTAVQVRSLGTVLVQAEADMYYMHIDSDDAVNSIPIDYISQLMLHMIVKTFNFSFYLCTGETEIICTILFYFPEKTLTEVRSFMTTSASRLCV